MKNSTVRLPVDGALVDCFEGDILDETMLSLSSSSLSKAIEMSPTTSRYSAKSLKSSENE